MEHMAKKTCPHCGTSVESSRTVCPACRMVLPEKSARSLWLIIAGIIVVVILVAVVLLISPSQQTVTIPGPVITVPPTEAAASAPAGPTCTIAVTATKVPPSSIMVQVMSSTCSAGDVTELRVSLNGALKGTLGTSPGTGKTFAGTSGTNSVIVIARFADGAERPVYENAAL
jgi:predicted nucleic acid-binding Zn ribbon protein